jgi:hypothetical protein
VRGQLSGEVIDLSLSSELLGVRAAGFRERFLSGPHDGYAFRFASVTDASASSQPCSVVASTFSVLIRLAT